MSTSWSKSLAMAVALATGTCAGTAAAQIDTAAMRSLDEQVQEIKSDVLVIASELAHLEEKLLFPAHSQVAVFVALDADANYRLDAVRLEINGEPATHHIYSFKELEALQSGGVQRLYTANLARGEHALDVAVIGKTPDGKDFQGSSRFTFAKGVEPQTLGLTLSGAATVKLALDDW